METQHESEMLPPRWADLKLCEKNESLCFGITFVSSRGNGVTRFSASHQLLLFFSNFAVQFFTARCARTKVSHSTLSSLLVPSSVSCPLCFSFPLATTKLLELQGQWQRKSVSRCGFVFNRIMPSCLCMLACLFSVECWSHVDTSPLTLLLHAAALQPPEQNSIREGRRPEAGGLTSHRQSSVP